MGELTGRIETGDGNEERLAELADEFLLRHRAGECPSVEEYAAGHPDLSERIRELFPAMIVMEQDAGATLRLEPPAEHAGATVGRYKLLQRIGEGGFGVVYMAEQQFPVRRKVALKVIKPGLDTKQVIARFEAERQALAMMEHPNIAKVLDGGTTEAGRPYFVMELVHGIPITEFCDRNHMSPRERLELFVQVCRAVQHAHTKGVIHRDIKPTNVLVTLHEGLSVPKVIDFGVAKATGQQLTDRTLFTQFAQMVGTPLYMSPEQAEMSGIDLDTRSDVYSLGVLLYELLTGTTPVDRERLERAAFDEVRRIIREEEPPLPSTRLSTMGDQARSVSALRRSDPKRLGQFVRGELDWIVMKALQKERARRYETANGLAVDIQRYLRDEPVEACPPSAAYRLSKFARRHRVSLTAGAGFALLLVASAIVSTYQAVRIGSEQRNTLVQKLEADRQRGAAERERDRAMAAERKAVTEARKSEQIAAFLTDMLKAVGPSVALGRDTSMLRDILENTARRLDRLRGEPVIEADLRTVLGRVYADLADHARAEEMHRSALALRRELFGHTHADIAGSLVELGDALSGQQKWEEAERVLRDGLAMRRELFGNTHPETGHALFMLGVTLNRMLRAADAEVCLREALPIYRRHPDWDLAATLEQLAQSLRFQFKYAAAEPFARECLAIRREQSPANDLNLAAALACVGAVLRDQRRPAEAEPYFRAALEIHTRQLPAGHPRTLGTMKGLVESLIASGRSGEAVPLIDEFASLAEGRAGLREVIPRFLKARLRHFQESGDVAGCRATAEMWERLHPTDACSLYEVACCWGVAAAARSASAGPSTATAGAAEAERAMEWLTRAIRTGYGDVSHIMQDNALDALRHRNDFHELMASLKAPNDSAAK